MIAIIKLKYMKVREMGKGFTFMQMETYIVESGSMVSVM